MSRNDGNSYRFDLRIRLDTSTLLKAMIEEKREINSKLTINSYINDLIEEDVKQYFLNKDKKTAIKKLIVDTENEYKKDNPDTKKNNDLKRIASNDRVDEEVNTTTNKDAPATQKKVLKKEQIKKLDMNTLIDLL